MRALGEIKDGVTLYKAISDAANAPGFGPGHGVLGPTRISSLTTLSTSASGSALPRTWGWYPSEHRGKIQRDWGAIECEERTWHHLRRPWTPACSHAPSLHSRSFLLVHYCNDGLRCCLFSVPPQPLSARQPPTRLIRCQSLPLPPCCTNYLTRPVLRPTTAVSK